MIKNAWRIALVLICDRLDAVEMKELNIRERWGIVGIIAAADESSTTSGIVVLKNLQTNKTYTLTVGDNLPNDYSFVVKSVRKRHVLVGNKDEQHELAFVEAKEEESKPHPFDEGAQDLYDGPGFRDIIINREGARPSDFENHSNFSSEPFELPSERNP